MQTVKSVTKNNSGDIIYVHTNDNKTLNPTKALFFVKIGKLKGLRLEISPFTGKQRLAVTGDDVKVELRIS